MPKKRGYRLITFKAFYDSDADIIDWWDSIEMGERSDALRDMICEYLGLPAKGHKRLIIPELADMRQDILWIHDALNDMPDYLNNIMRELASTRPQGEARASPQDTGNSDPALTEAESQRRTRRLKNSTW